jgi:hypothetical protein
VPWTSHGYWTGLYEPAEPGPPRLDCGGPHRCMDCAEQAHRLEAEAASVDTTPAFDEPLQFSVEVSSDGTSADTIAIRIRGIALNADSLTRSIGTCVTTALDAVHPVPTE